MSIYSRIYAYAVAVVVMAAAWVLDAEEKKTMRDEKSRRWLICIFDNVLEKLQREICSSIYTAKSSQAIWIVEVDNLASQRPYALRISGGLGWPCILFLVRLSLLDSSKTSGPLELGLPQMGSIERHYNQPEFPARQEK